MRDRTGRLGEWLALREVVALPGSTGGPLRLARAGPWVCSPQKPVLEVGSCQAPAMKGAESVCKGEIMTMARGH